MAEKNSLWKNIRNKAKQNKRTGATPKKPTAEMLRQERKIKAKKYPGGGETNPLYKSNEDYAYEAWRNSLPQNLRQESEGYDLRGAWEAGLQPEYITDDMAFHLSSRNPNTGEILKLPGHDTYNMAIEGDIRMGYTPRVDLRTGKIYTTNSNDPAIEGPFAEYPNVQPPVLLDDNIIYPTDYPLLPGLNKDIIDAKYNEYEKWRREFINNEGMTPEEYYQMYPTKQEFERKTFDPSNRGIKLANGGPTDDDKKFYRRDSPEYKDYLIRKRLSDFSKLPYERKRELLGNDNFKSIFSNSDALFEVPDDKWNDILSNKLNEFGYQKYGDDAEFYYETKDYNNPDIGQPTKGIHGSSIEYDYSPNVLPNTMKTVPIWTQYYYNDPESYYNYSNLFKKYKPSKYHNQTVWNDRFIGNTYGQYIENRPNAPWRKPYTKEIEDETNFAELQKYYPDLTKESLQEDVTQSRENPEYITNKFNLRSNRWNHIYPSEFVDIGIDKLHDIDWNAKRGRYYPESIVNDLNRFRYPIPHWDEPSEKIEVLPELEYLKPIPFKGFETNEEPMKLKPIEMPFFPSKVLLREMGDLDRNRPGGEKKLPELYMDDGEGWRPIDFNEYKMYKEQYPGADTPRGWIKNNKANGGYLYPDGGTLNPSNNSSDFNKSSQNTTDFFRQWYKGRAMNPKFTDVANKRLELLNSNTYPKTEILPYDKMSKEGFYDPTNNIIKYSDKDLNNRYYDGNINSLITHETDHYLSNKAPQEFINANSIIDNNVKKNKKWLAGENNLHQDEEIRARLSVWRQLNSIDPTKDYSLKELRSIINKNLDDENLDNDIKDLYESIKFDAEKLKYFNDSFVSNQPKNTNIQYAANGGYMYPDGGKTDGDKTKVYTDPKQFKKAEQAYNDSLLIHNYSQDNLNWYNKNKYDDIRGVDVEKFADRESQIMSPETKNAWKRLKPDPIGSFNTPVYYSNTGEIVGGHGFYLYKKPEVKPILRKKDIEYIEPKKYSDSSENINPIPSVPKVEFGQPNMNNFFEGTYEKYKRSPYEDPMYRVWISGKGYEIVTESEFKKLNDQYLLKDLEAPDPGGNLYDKPKATGGYMYPNGGLVNNNGEYIYMPDTGIEQYAPDQSWYEGNPNAADPGNIISWPSYPNRVIPTRVVPSTTEPIKSSNYPNFRKFFNRFKKKEEPEIKYKTQGVPIPGPRYFSIESQGGYMYANGGGVGEDDKPIAFSATISPVEITAKRTIWDKLKGFARQFPGVDFDEYQRSKALQEKYQNAWFPESPKNLPFIEQRALEDGRSAYRPSTIQYNPTTGKIIPASGYLDPVYPEAALLPASLPIKATSGLGKAALFAAETQNPGFGFGKMFNNLGHKTASGIIDVAQALPAGSASDNLLGLGLGISDINKGRPFFQTFPITKKQKLAVELSQDKAFNEGLDFVKNWNYSNNGSRFKLRPEVEERIEKIYPYSLLNTSTLSSRNPIFTAKNSLVNTKRSFLSKNKDISDKVKNYIASRRGKIGGVNSANESITLRNHGFYYNKPERIKDVAAHELGHSMQKFGNDFYNWGDVISKNDPDYLYRVANTDTPFGKIMGDAMVDPIKGKHTWEASPLEPHSELMVARMKVFDDFKKKGMNDDEIMQMLQNPNDEIIDLLISKGNLDRFFKPTTSHEDKRTIVKGLPSVISTLGLGTLLYQSQQNNKPQQQAYGGYTSPYMYYSGGPIYYGNGGKAWKHIGAGAYALGEGMLDTLTMGATDQLTDKGYYALQKAGNKNLDLNDPEVQKYIKTQDQIKGYGNTAAAITTAAFTGQVGSAVNQSAKGLNTAFQASDWATDDFKKWSNIGSQAIGIGAGFVGGSLDSAQSVSKLGESAAKFGAKASKYAPYVNQAVGMFGRSNNNQTLLQQVQEREEYLNSPEYLAMKEKQNQEYVNRGLSFSNGGNINNNSLNLQNSMRNRYNSYRKKSKGGTFHQYGINQIPDSAGLHHQNAYGGVPIGPDAMAEGGEYVLDGNYVVSDQVDGMNTQTDEFGNTMAENLKTRLNKYTLRDLDSKNKGQLRRPNDSIAQNTIDQIKQQAIMETEMARAEAQAKEQQNMAMREAAVQYAAAGGKLNKDITKIVEEEYAAAYGGYINPKKYKGLNMPYSKGGKLPKEVLRARVEAHMSPEQADAYVNQYAEGGGIHIKESKKGTFTAAATKHGKSVQEFAKQVLANKGNYSSAMVKKANFARNAAGWKHAYGGPMVSNVSQPFTGPSAQNRGGMMIEYGRGGMMYANGGPDNPNSPGPDYISMGNGDWYNPKTDQYVYDYDNIKRVEPLEYLKPTSLGLSDNQIFPTKLPNPNKSMPELSDDDISLSPFQRYLATNYPKGLNQLTFLEGVDDEGINFEYGTTFKPKVNNKIEPDEPESESKEGLTGLDYTSMAAQAAGPLSQLYYGLKGPDDVNYERITADKIDPYRAITLSNEESRRAQDLAGYNLRQYAPTSGSYMANMRSLGLQAGKQRGAQTAATQYEADVANTQMQNQVNAQNAQIAMQEQIDRLQEKDAARTNVTEGLSGMGSSTANMIRDYRINQVSQLIAKNLGTTNWTYDKDGNLIFRDANGNLNSVPYDKLKEMIEKYENKPKVNQPTANQPEVNNPANTTPVNLGYLSPEGYAAINEFENTMGTYDETGKTIGMNAGSNYAQTADKQEIENFINTTIGKDTWDKLPENVKTQAYGFMFNNGVTNKDGSVNYNSLKGLAQAINNATGGKDLGDQRRNYKKDDIIKLIKNTDFNNTPYLYENYVNVLGDQYTSIATNTNKFKKGPGAIYAPTLMSRARTMHQIMNSKNKKP